MEEKTVTIGKEYSLPQLIKFASGPVFTEFALSLLMTVDDGLFISRYIGFNALAAFSLVSPIFFIKNAIGSLLCGAEPHCSIKLGEKKNDEANSDFTTTVYAALILGFIFALVASFFVKPFLLFLGASDLTMPYAYPLTLLNLWIYPISLLTTLFARFYVPAGKPQYAMLTTLMSGFLNLFFDYVLIARAGLGIYGACITNYISCIANCLFGLWFYNSKQAEVKFSKVLNPKPTKLLTKEFSMGVPGMFTSLALSLNSLICNKMILRIADESYLSAYTIVNNIQFVFMSAIFGLDGAICPIIGYAYGEKNERKLKKIIKQSIEVMALLSILIIATYYIGYKPLTALYMTVGYDGPIKETVYTGLRIAPAAFVFFGFNVLAIDALISMNKSKESTIITIFENCIFANSCVIIMGFVFGMFGIWFSFAVQEMLCMGVVFIILKKVYKKGLLS